MNYMLGVLLTYLIATPVFFIFLIVRKRLKDQRNPARSAAADCVKDAA
jgi:hypothetical protein